MAALQDRVEAEREGRLTAARAQAALRDAAAEVAAASEGLAAVVRGDEAWDAFDLGAVVDRVAAARDELRHALLWLGR